jgi:PKD repeat protein
VSLAWVYPGNPANFSCAATGGTAPYAYSWTFSDSGTSAAQNPAHAFAAPGSSSGICTARDANGTTGSVTLSVTVVPASGSGPTAFFVLSPCRLLDTRDAVGPLGGPSIGPGGSPDRVFLLVGTCGIPSDARSLVTNVTVTNVRFAGDLSVFGGNDSPNGTTSVSFRAGATRANANVVRLGTDGSGTIRVRNNSAAPVDLVLDVSGYFQ